MKSDQWKTYRTRFLVKAKQLNFNLSFTDPLGRQHAGRKGDYLVESCDGVLCITPRQIFEDIYVPMSPDKSWNPATDSCRDGRIRKPAPSEVEGSRDGEAEPAPAPRFEPLPLEKIRAQKHRATPSLFPATPDPARVRRKDPQPFRPASPRVGLM